MAGHSTLRAVLTAVLVNGIITLAKGVGWLLTWSPSMLAESIHSFADSANQFLLFIGIKSGEREPSREHPWGYGQARYFWNLVSALGIFFVGFGVTTYHGVGALLGGGHPEEGGPSWTGIVILLFAFLLEGWSLLVALEVVRRQLAGRSLLRFVLEGDDPTAAGVLLEDGLAVLGVLLALLGIWLSQVTGSHVPDALASILIGLLLGLMAILLARVNGRLLIDVALPEAREREIEAFLLTRPEVEKVVELRSTVAGPGRVRLSLELELHGGILVDSGQIEREASRIREGAEPLPVLTAVWDRAVRQVGRKTDELERAIRERFPDIESIDLEVN